MFCVHLFKYPIQIFLLLILHLVRVTRVVVDDAFHPHLSQGVLRESRFDISLELADLVQTRGGARGVATHSTQITERFGDRGSRPSLRGRARRRCDGRRGDVDHVDRDHLLRAIKKSVRWVRPPSRVHFGEDKTPIRRFRATPHGFHGAASRFRDRCEFRDSSHSSYMRRTRH